MSYYTRQQIEEAAAPVINRLESLPKVLETHLCGGYRRGKPLCGDADILVVSHDPTFLRSDLPSWENNIPAELRDVIQPFAATRPAKSERVVIDILSVTPNRKGAAISFLTGPRRFNRWMKILAGLRGMHYDHGWGGPAHGHFSDNMGWNGLASGIGLYQLPIGELIITETERDFFEAVGLDYVHPENRDNLNAQWWNQQLLKACPKPCSAFYTHSSRGC